MSELTKLLRNFPDDEWKLLASQVNPESALEGELGGIPNPYGGYSTEISSTVSEPGLNEGRYTNIPTLVEGMPNVESRLQMNQLTPEQYDVAVNRAIERQSQGQSLPSYDSRVGAEFMAGARSDMKDLARVAQEADALRNATGQITEAEMGAFNDLNQMSEQSPTGGALGQISGAEMGALSLEELQDMILKERYSRY